MTNTFIHVEDKIYINNREFQLNVLKTFDPTYSIPEGWTRFYIQGKKHYIKYKGHQENAELPWKNGDYYIKSIKELMYLEKQLELDKEIDVNDNS